MKPLRHTFQKAVFSNHLFLILLFWYILSEDAEHSEIRKRKRQDEVLRKQQAVRQIQLRGLPAP